MCVCISVCVCVCVRVGVSEVVRVLKTFQLTTVGEPDDACLKRNNTAALEKKHVHITNCIINICRDNTHLGVR